MNTNSPVIHVVVLSAPPVKLIRKAIDKLKVMSLECRYSTENALVRHSTDTNRSSQIVSTHWSRNIQQTAVNNIQQQIVYWRRSHDMTHCVIANSLLDSSGVFSSCGPRFMLPVCRLQCNEHGETACCLHPHCEHNTRHVKFGLFQYSKFNSTRKPSYL